MFTGIITHIGAVVEVRQAGGAAELAVDCGEIAATVHPGASIAVDGVCLTVTGVGQSTMRFDVVPETLRRTTLGQRTAGSKVNLESALCAGDPMDGHFVQGHVDAVAAVAERIERGGERVLWFEPDVTALDYLIPKGSVAVDGVSLTIAEVRDGRFSVALIPTTLSQTTLGSRRIGDKVNIETDILARTIVHALRSIGGSTGLSLETLTEHGFA